ncbi:MAG: hypothetical protein GX629_12305 [Phycisphaerae bacterium]|nr:hypothetical protein [Phycisphaerae bacterium]
MKVNKIQRVSIGVCLLGLMTMLVSCGGAAFLDIFNPDFVADTGLKPDANGQVTPNLQEYLWLKVTNQTNFPAQIRVAIKRAETGEEFFETSLMGNQTIGKLIEGCNSETNPVLNLYIPNLGEVGTGEDPMVVPVAQALVMVNGVPVIIPESQLPGVLSVRTDFECGDTVEFVIHNSFSDADRFRISALIYDGNTEPTESE